METVAIENVSGVPETALAAFNSLLSDLLPRVFDDLIPYPLVVFIVPDGQVEYAVNQVIRAGEQGGTYVGGQARAVAVPVSASGNLTCYIVVGHSLISSLTPEHCHLWDTVSSILEELFHARLYMTRWSRSGPASLPRSDSPITDILILAAKMHDEFAVMAMKTQILSTVPLVDCEEGLSIVQIGYGDSVARLLDEAPRQLAAIVGRAASDPAYTDAWLEILNVVYRLVLEPLARDAACRTAYFLDPTPRVGDDASESGFYRDHVATYWNDILGSLERSHTSEFADMETAFDQIQQTITSFLAHVGVHFRLVQGQWRLFYDEGAPGLADNRD